MLERLADEQRQRRLGGLEFVALAFQFLDARRDGFHLRHVGLELETEFGGLHQNVRAARHVADEHAAEIPDGGRVNVFVAARHAVNRVHVHPALVRKCRLPHPRLARVVPDVGDLIHELGKFLELGQRVRGHAGLFQFEMQAAG